MLKFNVPEADRSKTHLKNRDSATRVKRVLRHAARIESLETRRLLSANALESPAVYSAGNVYNGAHYSVSKITPAVAVAPMITQQPGDENVAETATASFTSAASGSPAPTVQWQFSNDGMTWIDLIGATSPTLTFSASLTQNGDQFQAVFTNASGTATSNPATLTVTPATNTPTITLQPTPQTVALGAPVTFTAGASNQTSVQWQYSADGTNFFDVIGATSDSLTFTPTAGENGYFYQAVYGNGAGPTTTNAVVLTVTSPPSITAQPAPQTTALGGPVTFTAAASNATSVQWQYSADGTNWTNAPGATADTLTFTPAANQNGLLFRALFSNATDQTATNPALLTVNSPPSITTQPTPQTTALGGPVTFTAAASNATSVQWQYSADGMNWTNAPGATADTLTFTPTANQNGLLFRALFSNATNQTATNPTLLTVNSPPTITTQPTPQSTALGGIVSFTAAAANATSVQWQYSPNGSTWTQFVGATKNTYAFTPTASENGYLIQAVFTNAGGQTPTNAVLLTVTSPTATPTITTQPTPQSTALGGSVSFTAAATGATSVKWQFSTDGTTYNDVVGATSATYSFTPIAAENGYLFRAVFSNSTGPTTTNAALLTVISPVAKPTISTQPTPQSTALGGSVTFTVAGAGQTSIQWRISVDGITYTDIAAATSATYSFTPTAGQNGDLLLAVLSNSGGSTVSNPAALTVISPPGTPTITSQPNNQTTTLGDPVTFTAAASAATAVQWQTSLDGTTWANIAGATSASYTFTPTANQNGSHFRVLFTGSAGTATSDPVALTIAAVSGGPADQLVIATALPTYLTAGTNLTIVVNAQNSAGQVDPLFAGNVTLQLLTSTGAAGTFNGPTTMAAVDGVATFTGLQVAEAGFYSIAANAAGTKAATTSNFNAIPAGATPPAAVPAFGNITLPLTAIAGGALTGNVRSAVTNTGAAALHGRFTFNLFISADPALNGSQISLATFHSSFKLAATKSKAVNLHVKIRSLAASVGVGTYYILIESIDPTGQITVATAPRQLQVVPATVVLNIAAGNVAPATIAAGKSATLAVTISNTGNSTSSGPFVLSLGISANGSTPIAGMALTQISSRQMRLKPGKGAKFRLHFKATGATPAGTYFPYLTASVGNVTQTNAGAIAFILG